MSNDQTRVLVVEDDPNIRDLVRSNLLARGYDVIVSTDGSNAVRLVLDRDPHVVLLDLTLPGMDGLELCREIRHRFSLGIIVVSARRAESDKVMALNLGADDYMTKPFSINELLARIQATLRRTRPAALDEPIRRIVDVGNVTIHLDDRAVFVAGERVHLTPTEFSLLRELAEHQGKVLTHAMLLQSVWGPGYASETEYTRAYVKRLRAKLQNEGCPVVIVTEPRIGYRLHAD